MKHALALSILILALAGSGRGQVCGTDSSDVPNRVMSQVVSRILRAYFKPSRRVQTVYITDAGIRRSWLPKIGNVRFIVVTSDKRDSRIGSFYTFLEPEKKASKWSVGFGTFNPRAGGTGDCWNFYAVGREVRIWRTGEQWGSSGSDRRPSRNGSP